MAAECLNEDLVLRCIRGELSPGEQSSVDHHIDGCQGCRVLLSSLAAAESANPELAPTELASGLRHFGPPSDTDPARPSSPSLAPGAVLADRFVVETLIGAGGMAHVFRGHDRRSGSRVAIKAIEGHGAEEIQRFEREARVLMSLEHPGIVRYVQHDRGPGGTPYLVMEWLDGEDLSARLARGALSVDETVTLGARVSSALAATHALGIVHRDIKPSNLFLKDGLAARATVLDYGVARPSWHQAASHATRTGTLLGTLGYMAPEQALGAKTADHRADIFSLGCVLFECLTGRRLFGGAHAVEVLANLLTQSVPNPRASRPEVPARLDALVLRMLARDPTARPASAAEVADALARSTEPGPPSARGTNERSGTRRAVVAAAAVALVMAVGLAVAPRLRGGGPASAPAHPDTTTVVATPLLPPVPTEALPPPSAAAATPSSSSAASSSPANQPQPPASRDSRTKRAPAAESDPFGTYRN